MYTRKKDQQQTRHFSIILMLEGQRRRTIFSPPHPFKPIEYRKNKQIPELVWEYWGRGGNIRLDIVHSYTLNIYTQFVEHPLAGCEFCPFFTTLSYLVYIYTNGYGVPIHILRSTHAYQGHNVSYPVLHLC